MSLPKHYSLVKEHPASFEVHDSRDDRRFHVAKQPLTLAMRTRMGKMQHFDEGGTVQKPRDDDKPPPGQGRTLGGRIGYPGADKYIPLDKKEVKNYAGGGGVQGVSETSDAALGNPQAAAPPVVPPMFQPNPPIMPGQAPGQGVPAFSGADGLGGAAPPMPIATSPADLSGGPELAPGSAAQNPISDMAAARGNSLDELGKGFRKALDTETKGADEAAKAWGEYGKQNAKLETYDQVAARHKATNDAAMKAFEDKTIDPDRYWNNKSTASKISASLGMILGGLGAGIGGGENMAAKAIHAAIDRDIDAQKEDKSKAMNLWKMNREATQDDLQANLMTRNQLLNAVEAKTKMLAASMGGAEAYAKFAPTLADIDRQRQENNLRLGLAQGKGMSETDPAKLVPMLIKNPEQQQKVYGEIEAAQNTKHMAKSIIDSFEQAAKENTVMRTGAGMLRTPGSVYALHQAMQPTFKDLEGTVRQAAMENTFKNITPAPGDFESTVQDKRKALYEYLKSKASAPIAKGNGLDLTMFNSTAPMDAPAETKNSGGVAYVKVPGGWKRAQ